MSPSSTPSLRDRQAEQLRAELRHRFVTLVLERGFEGFTMQDLADAAGVSVRTLYRYFPSREAIAEDLRQVATRQLREEAARRSDWLTDPDFLAATFRSFEERADLIRAARVLRQAGHDPSGVHERTVRMRERLTKDPGVDAAAVEQLTGLLRLLGGSDAWLRLTEDDLSLDSTSAGHAAQWAMEVLLEAARTTTGPLRPHGRTSP